MKFEKISRQIDRLENEADAWAIESASACRLPPGALPHLGELVALYEMIANASMGFQGDRPIRENAL